MPGEPSPLEAGFEVAMFPERVEVLTHLAFGDGNPTGDLVRALLL